MDPIDFHKTADILKDRPEECHIRTTINRAYYGLFLYLRDFLEKNSIVLPKRKKKSHHQFVMDCFKESRKGAPRTAKVEGNKQIGQIYLRLKTLFQNRTSADYKLHLKFHQKDGEDKLRLARDTLEHFEQLRGSTIENHIIDTAKNQATLYM